MTQERVIFYLIATVCLSLAFIVTDCSMGQVKYAEGTVLSKQYTPPRTYTEPVRVGDVTTIQTRHEPASWALEIEVRTGTVRRSVSPQEYESAEVGDRVDVKYRIGRFTGWNY